MLNQFLPTVTDLQHLWTWNRDLLETCLLLAIVSVVFTWVLDRFESHRQALWRDAQPRRRSELNAASGRKP